MDDSASGSQGSQRGARLEGASSVKSKENNESAWDSLLETASKKTSVLLNTLPADSSAMQACTTSKGDVGRGREEHDKLSTGDGYNYEEDNIIVENGMPAADDGDEEEGVVDVSPTGYSLSALDSFLEQEAQKFPRIKNMYIFDNTFTVLPTSMSRLRNLRNLKIFSNEVRLLPDEVGQIAHLEHLQMKVCPSGLGTALPPLGNLISLRTLELRQTPLRASVLSFPPGISKLQMLTRLAICNFSISFLPPEIGELKSLEELDLSFNKLKTLPAEICSLAALKHLRADNNKLSELPPGLANLSNLCSIDVAHNRLTSLPSLGLSGMTSLKTLNVKFNKLRRTFQIPEWIDCDLEGNPSSPTPITRRPIISSREDEVQDSELLPFAVESDELTCRQSGSFSPKDGITHKNPGRGKGKRGWKRHDYQQLLQARQDRLNLSRKLKPDHVKRPGDLVTEMHTASEVGPNSPRLVEDDCSGLDGIDEKKCMQCAGVDDVSTSDGVREGETSGKVACQSFKEDTLSENISVKLNTHIDNRVFNSHSSREVVTGVRSNPCPNASSPEADQELSQTFIFKSKPDWESDGANGRRKGGFLDRNPKPKKRRKSAQMFSGASFRYRSQSICGFDDRLEDGFYDAGREHPFTSLEDLECEQPCLDSREVILVDRDRDEELDVIALSAQHLLAGLDLAGGQIAGHEKHSPLNNFQKAAVLSLFVSDCFGGSDKTLNVTKARRAALGGLPGVPFVCSCSSRFARLSTSHHETPGNFQTTVPTVHMLSEAAIKFLKLQRQSNVVPLGSLPYGVCRHRAILFKYLCDKASIPCELVRGYLDYVPHAWNVVLASKENTNIRRLVDACRPLDIREEKDSEYFCRYIPFRRFQLPTPDSKGLSAIQSDDIVPSLHEEIGRGASGSVVQRCSLGSFTAAAKVLVFDQASERLYQDVLSRYLSELRILCCLGEHPHIVSFYGHEFSYVANAKQGTEVVQLMIFMEYVQGYSLEIILGQYANDGRRYMPPREAAFVARAIAHALSYVHSRGILHRDIKSSNILVDLDTKGNRGDCTMPSIKLCDFDSAVPLSSSSSHTCYVAHRGVPSTEVCVGTPRWMAPEVFRAMYNQQPYGLEADIWSFGCMLLEMLSLEVPYAGLSESQIQSDIQKGRRPQLPVQVEELVSKSSSDDEIAKGLTISAEDLKFMKVLVSLYKSCTMLNPQDRPTALEAYEALSMGLSHTNGDVNDPSKSSNTVKTVSTSSPAKPSNEKSTTDAYSEQRKIEDCQSRQNEDVALIEEIKK